MRDFAALHDPARSDLVAGAARWSILHDPFDPNEAPFTQPIPKLGMLGVEPATDEQRPRRAEDDGARRENARHRGLAATSPAVGAYTDPYRGHQHANGRNGPAREGQAGRVVDDRVFEG